MEARKVAEIATWVGLFLLIPGTALGFFSESSLPGQSLYPLKRGIEQVALTAQSFNNKAKALYEVELTNRRLAESTKLLAAKDPVYNFDDVYMQIAEAKASISTISDVTERKQAEQKLADTISLYQAQLVTIQSGSPINAVATPTPTPSGHPNNATSSNTNPTPTPVPTSNTTSTSSQIDTFNSALQQLKDTITTDQVTPTPTPTPTSISTPTPTPTPMPSHLPVFTSPSDGQSFKKGSWVQITVSVLNGDTNDKLTIYVNNTKLCNGSFGATCYWQMPNHIDNNTSFIIMAQNMDSLGRYTTKSITIYATNNEHSD